MKRWLCGVMGLVMVAWGAEDLDTLLQAYRASADLSEVTKNEKAGIIYRFSRDEIERMQARTLADLLKNVPVLLYGQSRNNIITFERLALSQLPINAVRIFIDDHDITTASFGSGLLIWGQIPIELFDHIEVYRNTSSIEFSSESSIIVIRLYSKTAERDEGSKVRMTFDTQGGGSIEGYNILNRPQGEHFFYLHAGQQRYKTYYHEFKDTRASISRDGEDMLGYARLSQGSWRLIAALNHVKSDHFLGLGFRGTPSGEGLDAIHGYIALEHKFEGDMQLALSYDQMRYDRNYQDLNLIYASPVGRYVQTYNTLYHDTIFSSELKKRWRLGDQDHLFGAVLIKRKEGKVVGRYDGITGRGGGIFWLASVMGEWHHAFGTYLKMTVGLKYDAIHYRSPIDDRNHLVWRTGLVYRKNGYGAKAFVTSTYLQTPLYKLSNIHAIEGVTSAANPTLKDMEVTLYSLVFSRFYGSWRSDIKTTYAQGSHFIAYQPSIHRFINGVGHKSYHFIEWDLSYHFDPFNYGAISYARGFGGNLPMTAHPQVVHATLFNRYQKIDFYQELSWYKPYFNEKYRRGVGGGIDYTVALAYRMSDALRFGVRGENLFHSGYKKYYPALDQVLRMVDRRMIVNVEYLF